MDVAAPPRLDSWVNYLRGRGNGRLCEVHRLGSLSEMRWVGGAVKIQSNLECGLTLCSTAVRGGCMLARLENVVHFN